MAECRPACPKPWLRLLAYCKLGMVTVVRVRESSQLVGRKEEAQKFKDKPGYRRPRLKEPG